MASIMDSIMEHGHACLQLFILASVSSVYLVAKKYFQQNNNANNTSNNNGNDYDIVLGYTSMYEPCRDITINRQPQQEEEKTTTTTRSNNHHQQCINENLTAADLKCPISLALPIIPVRAEDGKVYDREAIEEYFQRKEEDNETITSPWTRQDMKSTHLVPSLETASKIESMIGSGIITGQDAIEWEKGSQQHMEFLLSLANKGYVKYMVLLGFQHYYQKNDKGAYKWFDTARGLGGSVIGKVMAGIILISNPGPDVVGTTRSVVEEDDAVQKGMDYLYQGLKEGSDVAAYALGMILAEGGGSSRSSWFPSKLDAFHHRGVYYFSKYKAVMSLLKAGYNLPRCRHQHLSPKAKEMAKEKLRQIFF